MTKHQEIYMMLDANAITNVVDAYEKGFGDGVKQGMYVDYIKDEVVK